MHRMRRYKLFMTALLFFCFCTGGGMQASFVSAATGEGQGHYTEVYYFHGKARCYSCVQIEKLTVEAIRSVFSKELENGDLKLAIVNVSDPENQHFVKDYKLYSQSVVLSHMEDGRQIRWKNLIRVWELLNSEEKFKAYISEEVIKFMKD